jgi:hypothetical protein
VLGVDVLLHEICLHLYRNGRKKADIVYLTAVAKSFHTVSIGVLWRTMDSILPLIKLLPARCINMPDTDSLTPVRPEFYEFNLIF